MDFYTAQGQPLFEPGGSACCYKNGGDGTQCSHLAQRTVTAVDLHGLDEEDEGLGERADSEEREQGLPPSRVGQHVAIETAAARSVTSSGST